MQHALGLVGKQRHGRFLGGPFTTLDLDLVFMAKLPTLTDAAAVFQPRLNFLRDADLWHFRIAQLTQRCQRGLSRTIDQLAFGIKPFHEGARPFCLVLWHTQRIRDRVNHHVNAI